MGYHGSGYSTKIYEYDYDKTIGYEGEAVPLRFLEETKLPKGKVMYFMQLPPDDLSISVNVLKTARGRDQYGFDLERRVLLGKVNNDALVNLIRLGGIVGGERMQALLSDLAGAHPSRRARLAAYEAVAQQEGATAWARAARDSDELVRVTARQRIRRAEDAA